ncbi:MAG: hypothetical protein ABI741_08355 [Ferruginibacter sp.]
MKSLSKLTFALMLCLAATAGFSQSSKPKIFADFPNTINCTVSEFTNAFSATEGQHIILSFSDGFKFSGTVISNVVKYSDLQSMTIRADQSDKTIFHLSKQINQDNSVSYVGRIINPTAADGYEVKKDMSGNYKFEKTDAEKVLQECNL